MLEDARGLALTAASPAAASAFDAAIRDYLDYRLSAGERVKQALAADPGFVMGHCLRGCFLMLLGSRTTLEAAGRALAAARAGALAATPREQAHVRALAAWQGGDAPRACAVWEAILAEHPRDLLALRLHHFQSFWLGRSAALRDAPAAVLDAFEPATPGYGNVLGMLAFGLEECGDYGEAERLGRRAVELSREDLWSIHAVAHVLEMQGRLADGMAWMDQPAGAWADRNPFKDHLWWHTALFPLERGDYARVLALYDAEVRVDAKGFYLDVQNAASLLMRLEFQGVDVGDRWRALADVAAGRIDDHVLPFTDVHVMMALAGDGRREEAERLLASLAAFGDGAPDAAARLMRPLVLPLCEAVLAFREGAFDRAVELLWPLRHDLQAIGASHAQRDVFAQLLIEAAIAAGRLPLARYLLAQRLRLRPHSRGGWLKYARLLEDLGEADRAAEAGRRAAEVG